MDVTTSTLEDLIKGKVRIGISNRLGCTTSTLQQFVNGGTSLALARKIGCTSSTLQQLRRVIGMDGAVGLLIGLCIENE